MASRLKLKKRKKHPPPFDDSEQQLNTDKDKTKQQNIMDFNNTQRSKTYAEVTQKSSHPKEASFQDKIDDKMKQNF